MTNKTWTIALMFGLPWTVVMIVYNSIIRGGLTPDTFIFTLMSGVVAGIVFASFMQFTAKRLLRTISIATIEGESIIKEAGANHVKGKEGVGGKLVLIDKRLIFKSHKFNIQNHQADFDLREVGRSQVVKTLMLFENGLTLQMKDQRQYKFIVDNPADWVQKISDQKRLIE